VEVRATGGVAEVVIDFPPVNALPVWGWHELATAVTAAGADARTRTVILAAEGRGFCAGVDIKEMQRTQDQQGGHEALLGANSGCFAAFAAVYDCPVPVIAAVHGFCLGDGGKPVAATTSATPTPGAELIDGIMAEAGRCLDRLDQARKA
jgi:enoyl-CoA hydratase